MPLTALGLVAAVWAGAQTKHAPHLHRWAYRYCSADRFPAAIAVLGITLYAQP